MRLLNAANAVISFAVKRINADIKNIRALRWFDQDFLFCQKFAQTFPIPLSNAADDLKR